MRKTTQERCGYETQYQWYVFKISGNPESWKRHIQALLPLSSMVVTKYMMADKVTHDVMKFNMLLYQLKNI